MLLGGTVAIRGGDQYRHYCGVTFCFGLMKPASTRLPPTRPRTGVGPVNGFQGSGSVVARNRARRIPKNFLLLHT